MNRREEEKAAQARKAASAQFSVKKRDIPRVISEREQELEAQAAKIAQLRALRLAKEAADQAAPPKTAQARAKRT